MGSGASNVLPLRSRGGAADHRVGLVKRLVLAAATVALLAPAVAADPGSCLDLTDPVGDVTALGVLPAVPRNAVADGVDVVSVSVEAETAGALSVTFSLAGPPAPPPGMTYDYRMTFSDAANDYVLSADVRNLVPTVLTGPPYELYVTPRSGGWPMLYSVSGSVDLAGQTVTVAADTTVLGDMDPGREFAIEAFETSGGPALPYGPLDTVAGPHTLVVGAGCP